MADFRRPEELMDYMREALETEAGAIGLAYVGYGDVQLVPKMPAVIIEAAPVEKSLHATRQWLNRFNLMLWIYHANLNASHATRTKEDLELTTRLVDFLHSNLTLGGKVIMGWVISEYPQPIPLTRNRAAVGTRLIWSGEAREMFP